MIYPLLKSSAKLLQKVQYWARLHRSRLGIMAEYRPNGEIRLIPASHPPLVDADNLAGCTLSIRDNSLIVACAETCAQIEQAIAEFLRKAKLIGPGRPTEEVVPFRRMNIRHAHELGRPISEQAKAKRRERRDEAVADRPPARFSSVLEAALAAEEAAGSWLVLADRAKKTAEESNYVDPDYVYQALVDLAHAARHNSDHQGLGMSWAAFLGQLGSHDFVPNSSPDTIKRYHKEYHIRHEGEDLCIGAHIRQGNGSADECLRIYVVQPRKPGDPVIVGQIGAHLPIADRSH
ncbi:MAG: hypothetical protein FJ397_12415 [Verrucomicrobia bacterium]|nr:hypothetical protein [Verrucomicrobiota bacterium]